MRYYFSNVKLNAVLTYLNNVKLTSLNIYSRQNRKLIKYNKCSNIVITELHNL